MGKSAMHRCLHGEGMPGLLGTMTEDNKGLEEHLLDENWEEILDLRRPLTVVFPVPLHLD